MEVLPHFGLTSKFFSKGNLVISAFANVLNFSHNETLKLLADMQHTFSHKDFQLRISIKRDLKQSHTYLR
jgi:hypothetical protein